MKKMLLLAAVAAMGVGYGSEDNSYRGSDPIFEENLDDAQSGNLTAVGENGEKTPKRTDHYLFLNMERYGKNEAIASILSKDAQNCPYSEQDRDLMSHYKEFILHENGVTDDVAAYLLTDKTSSNIFLGMPATVFTTKATEPGKIEEFNVICMYLLEEESTPTLGWGHPPSNFIFDTSIGINGVSFAKDLIVLGDCTMSGKVNVGRYLLVKGEATITIEAEVIIQSFILPGYFSIGGTLIVGNHENQQTIQNPGTYILKNETNDMTTKVDLYEGGSIVYGYPITVKELVETLEQYGTVLA